MRPKMKSKTDFNRLEVFKLHFHRINPTVFYIKQKVLPDIMNEKWITHRQMKLHKQFDRLACIVNDFALWRTQPIAYFQNKHQFILGWTFQNVDKYFDLIQNGEATTSKG